MCTFDGPRTATTDIFCEIKLTEKKTRTALSRANTSAKAADVADC